MKFYSYENKTINAQFFLGITLSVCFIGCSTDNELKELEVDETLVEYSQTVEDYQKFLSLSLYDIYYTAFDGENINEEKAIDIIKDVALQDFKIDMQDKFLFFPQLRSSGQSEIDYEMIENFFTREQAVLINELLYHENINAVFLSEIRNKALKIIGGEESKIVVDMVDIIDLTIKEIDKYATYDNNYLRASRGSTFGCNVAAGVIGGCFGFVAGALTGSVTGLGGFIVGGIVSTLVSATISTYACKEEAQNEDSFDFIKSEEDLLIEEEIF